MEDADVKRDVPIVFGKSSNCVDGAGKLGDGVGPAPVAAPGMGRLAFSFDLVGGHALAGSNDEKAIAAQKTAPAFKKSNEGSWFNAFENINECFKLIED